MCDDIQKKEIFVHFCHSTASSSPLQRSRRYKSLTQNPIFGVSGTSENQLMHAFPKRGGKGPGATPTTRRIKSSEEMENYEVLLTTGLQDVEYRSGSEKVSLGDILNDFPQQRFGVDTYERIETGMIMTNKIDAQKNFNSNVENMSRSITHLPICCLVGVPPIYLRCLIGYIRTAPCSTLMKDLLGGGTYSRDNVLVDEKKSISLPDKDLPGFWSGINGYESGPSEPSGSATKWHHNITIMAGARMLPNGINSLRYESIGYNR
ncbi:hypothetical protein M5K25_002929 [Dendrobium thyrsiflorum]|uniref:Uncharacterized protein n=1 Tax=Dendrobium thyrsiflorum TaxID=117978 RepID=A0ABD0VNV3_DENTH